MATISPDTTKSLHAIADGYTQDENRIPGLVYVVVNRDGEEIFAHASGHEGKGIAKPMTFDTSFWIASCTKLVTTIAAMQLVEQGKVALDSEDDIERILPEVAQAKVLSARADGTLELVKQERRITLRMLLAHTAGFGYSFGNPNLMKWYGPIGINEFDNTERDIFSQPLVNQPGSAFEYGVNLDWVGRLVERLSGLSLDEYCQRHILKPLGMSQTTFFPTEEAKANLAYVHTRNAAGSVGFFEHGHPFRSPLVASTPEGVKAIVNSGGAGLFSNPRDFCKILTMLLNQGKSPATGNTILKPDTIKEMFTNQIPEFPDFGRGDGPSMPKPSLLSAGETYPEEGDPPQGWGLSFFLHLQPSATGRAAGTAWWGGITNLIWWADVENGVGGMLATQILPYGDEAVFQCQADIEKAIYKEILPGSQI